MLGHLEQVAIRRGSVGQKLPIGHNGRHLWPAPALFSQVFQALETLGIPFLGPLFGLDGFLAVWASHLQASFKFALEEIVLV